MIRTRLAQRYARALFALAREGGRIEPIGQELAAVRELFDGSDELRTALFSPVLPRSAKSEVLEALLEGAQVDVLVGNLLRVLLEARKLALLPDVIDAYDALADEAAGRVRGEAVAPMPLDGEDLEALRAALARALDKEVLLSSRHDPALLGGVVARVGNLVFDGSVRTQLARMKETLIKG